MLKNHWQIGFTLTEVLVTIVVFALVTGAIYSITLFNQKAYREGETAAEITQNGRVILERMTREIRQAEEIVTVLPEERLNPAGEILFQDGHVFPISEEGTTQGVEEDTNNTIILSSDASSVEDYYKGMFIKVTTGAVDQIRKIDCYNGLTKIAKIEGTWDTIPVIGDRYKIDSFYYYIRYFVEVAENIKYVKREVVVYYFGGDPDTYVPWDAKDENNQPPGGPDSCIFSNCPDCPTTCLILQGPDIIGEYVSNLEYWGSRTISIALTLEKKNKSIELENKVFGRNL